MCKAVELVTLSVNMVPSVKSLSFPLVLAHVDDLMWLHRGTYVRRFWT